MSLASDARDAVRDRPAIHAALRAGVCNYSAVADLLAPELDGDREAVAAALRRYAADCPPLDRESRRATVRVRRGVSVVEETEPLLTVGGCAVADDGGDRAALLATGDVDAAALGTVLGRLGVAEVGVVAAGVGGDALVVVVDARDRTTALRLVERALDAVPTR